MRQRSRSRWIAGAAMPAVCALAGCNLLIGLDDVNVGGSTGKGTGGGGASSSSSEGGTSSGGSVTATHPGDTDTSSGGGGQTDTGTGEGGTTTSSGGDGGSTGCTGDWDCTAPLVCDTASGACVAPTCDDKKKDGAETAPDCGGGMCPPCTDGLGCAMPSDCKSGVCAATCQSPKCGDGVVNGADGCDDGNTAAGDGCSATCAVEPGFMCQGTHPSTCAPICGDGMIVASEQCDDGNPAGGDGCSSSCQVEPYYQCRTQAPMACTKQETLCNDGIDDDGDGAMDAVDVDCLLPPYAPQGTCNYLWIYQSVNVPVDIPDNSDAGAKSVIVVPDAVPISHMSVVMRVNHQRDADVVATLIPPFGIPRILTSGNGGNGANYHDTVFDAVCAQSVSQGNPPFSSCYKPQAFLPGNDQSAQGVWTLQVADKSSGQIGSLQAWTLVVCQQ